MLWVHRQAVSSAAHWELETCRQEIFSKLCQIFCVVFPLLLTSGSPVTPVLQTVLSYLCFISTSTECDLLGIRKLYYDWSLMQSWSLYLSHWFLSLPHWDLCGEKDCCTKALSCCCIPHLKQQKVGLAVKRASCLPSPPLGHAFSTSTFGLPRALIHLGSLNKRVQLTTGEARNEKMLFKSRLTLSCGQRTELESLHQVSCLQEDGPDPPHTLGAAVVWRIWPREVRVHCIRPLLVLWKNGQDLSATHANFQCVLELPCTP